MPKIMNVTFLVNDVKARVQARWFKIDTSEEKRGRAQLRALSAAKLSIHKLVLNSEQETCALGVT